MLVRARVSGGQIAAMMAEARRIVVRQSERGRASASSGGKGVELGMGLIDKQREEQMGVKPRSREAVVLGR